MELVARLKTGDKGVIDEIVLGHIRLAIYVAGLYVGFAPRKSKDLVSESLLALVTACHKVVEGKLLDDDFTRFAAFKMHRSCGIFVHEDKLIRIPTSSRYAYGLKDSKIINDKELPSKTTVRPLDQMIFDETLGNSIETERQQLIIDLRKKGHTYEEISQILDLNITLVTREVASVKKRFLKGENS